MASVAMIIPRNVLVAGCAAALVVLASCGVDRAGSDDWRIVRLDVSDVGTIATGAGIRVGSTEDEVRRAYGEKIKTEPHHYTADEGGHYMVLDVDGPGA